MTVSKEAGQKLHAALYGSSFSTQMELQILGPHLVACQICICPEALAVLVQQPAMSKMDMCLFQESLLSHSRSGMTRAP